MPGSDRTGPRGQGPMTGRGQGYCETPNNSNRLRFWGFGGFGRRWRNRFFSSGIPGRGWDQRLIGYDSRSTQKEEIEMLEEEAKYFEQELKNIRENIDLLKTMDAKE